MPSPSTVAAAVIHMRRRQKFRARSSRSASENAAYEASIDAATAMARMAWELCMVKGCMGNLLQVARIAA